MFRSIHTAGSGTRQAPGYVSLNARSAAPLMALLLLLAGCGQTYRPVVTPINPVGPAGQPVRYAVAISSTNTGGGLLTIVDYSGDTIVGNQPVLNNPPINQPLLWTSNPGGTEGFLLNAAGTLNIFPISNPSTLMAGTSIMTTTVPPGGNAPAINVLSTQAAAGQIFLPEPGRSAVALLSTAGLISQEIAVPANPVWVVGDFTGAFSSPRVFALSQPPGQANGVATAIETTTAVSSVSNILTVGNNPVYGILSTDGARAYVVNKGSGTVSVLNAQQNQLDSTTPTIPAKGTLGVNPVWDVLVPSLNELLVLNQGNGTTPGSVSIISVPTCNASTQSNNPLCNSTNIQDAANFGTVLATVPVGVNPTQMSVLSDGSKAYVVNSGNSAAGIDGSVSAINLTSNTVTATIPASSTSTSAAVISGHPNTIAASFSQPNGKVYVTAPDSQQMTIITAATDTVEGKIALQGLGMRVIVTAQ